YWLTGQQGKAPNPLYDPLEMAVTEAHKRGMELHAWFNPYRAVKTVGRYTAATNHVSVLHPDWILTVGTLKILNPGLAEVRDYVTSIIKDVVERYDIDAVHFDDYFYPYEGIGSLDAVTFASYPRGFSNIGDWRRDNVNIFVAQVDSMIHSTKPWVKFGISPFGIWKNGVPEGVIGTSSYSAIYCDPIAWLNAGTVDYIAPQCYWKIGGNQDYSKLAPWWAGQASNFNRHLYVGQIFGTSYTNTELPDQIEINRQTDGIQGNIIFRAAFLNSNSLGFADSLRTNIFKYPAITPSMAWRDQIAPECPANLQYTKISDRTTGLIWGTPTQASDGDTARRYVVYQFPKANIVTTDLDEPANILAVTYTNQYELPIPDNAGTKYFIVTALDDNSNESRIGQVVVVSPSQAPHLFAPDNYAVDQRDTVLLAWRPQSMDCAYEVRICPDSLFNSANTIIFSGISDTNLTVTGINGLARYFWQVKAGNAGGWSEFSDYYSFTTGFPATPIPVSPANKLTELPLNLPLVWNQSPSAEEYHLQVSKSLDFNTGNIVRDSSGIADTTFLLTNLELNRYYFWRLKASNGFGTSGWNDYWRFKTIPTAGVIEVAVAPSVYRLKQNYPNPFNNATTIEFEIVHEGEVSLEIYDLNGVIIRKLVGERLAPNSYKVIFESADLASGFYLCQLRAGKFQQTIKLVLLK
ncbi:MAG: family 10 glycosylhydrolase, partial [Candidatus Neomarinimicrobiota bacterium]